MIELKVDPVANQDFEDAVNDSIKRLCQSELKHLELNPFEGWALGKMYNCNVGRHKPFTDNILLSKTSNLGRLLGCEPVMLRVNDGTCVSRQNVVCNVMTIVFPTICVPVLAELISYWMQSIQSMIYQKALCDYYFNSAQSHTNSGIRQQRTSRGHDCWDAWVPCHVCTLSDESACVPGSPVLDPQADSLYDKAVRDRAVEIHPSDILDSSSINKEPQQRIDQLLNTLFRMLTESERHTRSFGRVQSGIKPPDLNQLRSLSSIKMMDVCFAHWYLSTARTPHITMAFHSAIKPSLNEENFEICTPAEPPTPMSTFIEVLLRSSREILHTMAPSIAITDRKCFEGRGTMDLVACLSQTHALQLLEMMVFHAQANGHSRTQKHDCLIGVEF